MGERLRPASFAGTDVPGELPPSSEQLRAELDSEAESILTQAQERAHCILRGSRAVLTDLAEALIAEESIEGEALERLLAKTHGLSVQIYPTPTNRVPVHAVPA